MKSIIAGISLLLASSVSAQDAGSTYDWQTGDYYSWNSDSSGNTRVRGLNFQTGGRWSTTIKPNGSQSGIDGGGNYWKSYGSTGYYQNFGTGETCIGTGYARRCF